MTIDEIKRLTRTGKYSFANTIHENKERRKYEHRLAAGSNALSKRRYDYRGNVA